MKKNELNKWYIVNDRPILTDNKVGSVARECLQLINRQRLLRNRTGRETRVNATEYWAMSAVGKTAWESGGHTNDKLRPTTENDLGGGIPDAWEREWVADTQPVFFSFKYFSFSYSFGRIFVLVLTFLYVNVERLMTQTLSLRARLSLTNRYAYLLQETELSLTNRATQWGGWPIITPLPIMWYHAEIGRSALKDVGINTGEPKKLGSAGTPLSWDERRGYPEIHAPPRHVGLLPRQIW